MDLGPVGRVRFLDSVCQGDGELRREVESLIAHDGAGEQRIAEALEGSAQALFESEGVRWRGRSNLGPASSCGICSRARGDRVAVPVDVWRTLHAPRSCLAM